MADEKTFTKEFRESLENKRIGSNFLGILNDIKRRPSDAAKELGWKPKVNFEKGIQDTIKWYLDHEDYWEDTPSSIFKPTPWKN